MSSEWTVRAHKDIKKKHIPLLEQIGLKSDYDEIVELLKTNPYSTSRNREKLNPKNKEVFSMRINNKHRVVYTIDKQNKIVTIFSAWSHYENRMPK